MNRSLFNKALDAFNLKMCELEAHIFDGPLINYSTADNEYVYLADHYEVKAKYKIATGEIIFDDCN